MILYVDLRDGTVIDPACGIVGEVTRASDTGSGKLGDVRVTLELDEEKVKAALESHRRSPVF